MTASQPAKTPASWAELLTVAEVARVLNVDDTTVRRWVQRGAVKFPDVIVLPHGGERNCYRIRRSFLDRLLDTNHASQPEV
jgi:excisionase family DNA binding protein